MRHTQRYIGTLALCLTLGGVIGPPAAWAQEVTTPTTVITGNDAGVLTERDNTACDAALTLHLPDVNPDDEALGSAVHFDGVHFTLYRVRDVARTQAGVAQLERTGVHEDMLDQPVTLTVPNSARMVEYTNLCDGVYVLRTAPDERFVPVADKVVALPFTDETGTVVNHSEMGVKLSPVVPEVSEPTTTPAPPVTDRLALTGSSSMRFMVAGTALVTIGTLAVLIMLRRNRVD